MVKASSSRLSSVLSGCADTIVAQATANGSGALAIIRFSGPEIQAVAERLCPRLSVARPREAQLVALLGRDGREIDRGVCTPYAAPRSFTGEDMLEAVVHGSPWVVEEVIATSVSLGARRAVPGEFTQRAVANGKMDLVQAEGVNELVRAETRWQARLAREQMHGSLSGRISPLREKITGLRARIEASLDFVDQGVVLSDEELRGALGECIGAVRGLLASFVVGERVREGARVVIVGPPNSGKSTLFNALLARERAIVAPCPGTTRDVLEAGLDMGGVPVVLVDTAGVRSTEDIVEAEGVRRAEAAAAGADLVVLLRSADSPRETVELWGVEKDRILEVISKSDLLEVAPTGEDVMTASCVAEGGLAELREAIERIVLAPLQAHDGNVAINRRHKEALSRAQEHLERSLLAPREVAAEDVREAGEALEELLGLIDTEAVLDAVFASFCLGK
ncbi:MAG: tRNA uridine-5-carboxymethylaminomethyl(34) synthesis GTPase MnmE [Thermoanaerobaculales bacterium]|nr:tRNA uridine-5-carboxymethylaminomethyl(34) synthesis GTPase MnmE [Thermoanaerobaculales bacterium]